jgi:outer membrane autotransporter protein
LAVNVQGGLSFGSRYTVLTADGGLTGQFSSVTGLPPATAFLAMDDTYDAHSVYLEVIKFRNFADAGLTPNQRSTGRGLDTIPAAGPLFNAVAGLTTDAQARAAFDQLSGEVHASAKTALIEDSRFVRAAGIDRLRAAFDAVGAPSSPAMAYASAGPVPVPATFDRFALWGQGFGSWGHTDSDGNAARLNRSTAGFLVGGDAPLLDTWRVGMLAGYSRSSFDVRDRASSGGSDNYHLGLYGGSQWGRLGFRAGAAYTWHDISTSRTVAFPGFADRLAADYNAGTAQLFGDVGYRIDLARLALEPFANIAYIGLHTGGFTERGGAAALTSRSVENSVTFTTLGLRASTDFALGGTNATARGALGWRHAFGDTTPFSTFAFAGGSAFAIAGAPIAQDAALVEAGLDLRVTSKATLGLSYGGQFGSHAHDQSFKANLGVRF